MSEIVPYVDTDLPHLADRVKQAVACGGVVGLPTETYYALGVNPFDRQAVDGLLRIKDRTDGKPILVLIGAPEQLVIVAEMVPPTARLLMDVFWPGPLTVLFPARPSLPANLTAETGTVGVRLTSCEPLRRILRRVGPLTGTSANRSGDKPVTSASAVAGQLGSNVDLVIDAGTTPGGPPSSVVEAREAVRVIREGAITRQMLKNVLETRGVALI